MPENDIYLISLETGGNQAYIFATNKLRNIVGASELLYRVGTSYVTRALEKIKAQGKYDTAIEDNSDQEFEIIISTSGKALLLARARDRAKEFITAWSSIVISEAPEVDAVAVVSKTPVNLKLKLDDKSPNSYMKVFKETERQMSLLRMQEGLPLTRFQRLPMAAECEFSGLPAVEIDKKNHLLSASCAAQRRASLDDSFNKRIIDMFPNEKSAVKCLNGLDSLDKLDWLAVIHADGNGLGQLFINFAEHVKNLVGDDNANGRHYIDYYRKFSKALDEISADAFKVAVWDCWGHGKPYIVPIVVGGDDLTVAMDGYDSIDFVYSFMNKFCSMTAEHPDTRHILESANMPQLGMCAGISIAKPHFPFYQSYHMAEELMNNAKLVKTKFGPDSIAVDFHILYDSISSSISDIRDKLKLEGRTLTEKPYVILEGNTATAPEDAEWRLSHKFWKFKVAVNAVKELPSSQAHAVRDALFTEKRETQESEWQFLLSSYPKFAEEWKKVQAGSKLYNNISNTDFVTCYLDALEAMKFWKDMEKGEQQNNV